ncbi:hypothetical protein ACXJQ9_08995 [Lactobacillus johnsonii]|uniref:Uncharacterized protein n=1 Tax=Lactobacillus johnsonii TaxID=33959 RepID=A0A9W3SL83_LACJH|nr:hypothetical protein [Lactobacillus johnsonii]AOG26243.1 hypothetical protein BBP16_05090 [Lactobacillus johnsonii]
MTHKKGIPTAPIVLLGFGFLTNSVTTSQAADQDTNFNVSKSLVENTIKPTLLSKKFKEDQIKEEKENKLADIKFEEKRLGQENPNSELDN